MIKIIKVKLNVDMLDYKAGSILTLTNQKYSSDGIFLDSYFKKRIKDAKIDNCLKIINSEIQSEKTQDQELDTDYKEIQKEVSTEIKDFNQKTLKKRGRPKKD